MNTNQQVQRSKPTHYVFNAYWIAEWPKVFMPETEGELQEAINEERCELTQYPKHIRRADHGVWPIGEHLTVGKDFFIDKDYKGQEIAMPLINQSKPL